MKRTAHYLLAMLLPSLFILSAGCKRDDPDHLKGIGSRIGSKLGGVLNKSNDRLTLQWRGGGEQLPPVDLRVQERLRWDANLQGTSIQVSAEDGLVVLSGRVVSAEQRGYAAQLARTTVGVTDVNLQLDIGPEPEQQ
jgi:hypothetical protein